MRALIQRVARASVNVEGASVAAIGPGLLVFLGVGRGDAEAEADLLAQKISKLRIFGDAAGKMNLAAGACGAAFLVVSQFTLYADAGGGNRPSFIAAAPPEDARRLYEYFSGRLRALGHAVQQGAFGEHMRVELDNDGPVTIWLDTAAWKNSGAR